MIGFFSYIFTALVLWFNFSTVAAISAVFFLILITLGSKQKTVFNPYFLFSATPLSLMLYDHNVSTYFLIEFDFYVTTIITLGVFSFILGLYLVKPTKRVRVEVTKRSFWIIVGLGVAPHILGILLAGVPILAEGEAQITAARENYQIPLLSQFSFFLPISIICAFREKSFLKISVSITLSLFFAVITVSKFTILLSLMFIVFAITKYGVKRKPSKLVRFGLPAIIVCFPLIFGVIHDTRSDLEQSEYQWRQQVSSDVGFIDTYGDILYLPYLYATSPWSNLAHNIAIQEELLLGKATVRPFISILQLDVFFPPVDKEIYQFPMNTHAFLTDFYNDFGAVGVCLLPFFLGMLVKHIYSQSIADNDVLQDGLWVIFGFATFMLFFSNHFTSVGYPFVFFLLVGGYKIISRSFIKGFS